MKYDIRTDIDNCQNAMEQHYNELGDSFTQYMNGINQRTQTTEKIISEYKNRLNSTNERNIVQMVNFLEKALSGLNDSLGHIDDKIGRSIDLLGKNLEQFHQVEDDIKVIKEYSELMELMALNSMVVAIKAGAKGGGFTYITEVLRKNASSTIQLTDELQDLGEQLKSNLGELHNLMSEMNSQRNEVDKEYTNIDGEFNEFHNSMGKFVNFLSGLSSQSASVRKNLLQVVEQLSHQDIYRQSLDHISILIDQLESSSTESDDEKLDKLVFYESMVKFSVPLISEVNERLDENIDCFRDGIQEIDGNLKKLEMDRKDFVSRNAGIKTDECCMFYRLSLLDGFINELVVSVKRFLGDIEGISMVNRSIVDRIINLQERNTRFERIIKAFRNVIIMGRIEVTKHDALRGVEVSVNDISEITDQMEKRVKRISESIQIVIQMNQEIVQRLQELKEEVTTFLDEFSAMLYEFQDIRIEGRNIFNKTMDSLDFYPKEFGESFKRALSASQQLENLVRSFDTLKENLNQQLETAGIEKKALLDKKGIENWEIKNENISKVLKQFTIFSQKMAFGEMAGETLDVQQAQDESSVTLF
jgi:methyl-accepting chemotaxis protein